MSTDSLTRDATEAFNRVARGNFQRVVDAYAALEPKLKGCGAALAAAIRRGDPDLMAFEYKRVEAFSRGIGALLNRIAAALQELDAMAGDPALAAVQTRAAHHVRALGTMKKTLTRKVQEINRLQAKAAIAIAAAGRRADAFDADWERLQDEVDATARTFEALHARMARIRQGLVSPASIPAVEELEQEAVKMVASASPKPIERLRAELARIGDAVVIETTSKAFAVQFRKERPKVERQLERMAEVLSFLGTTRHEARRVRVELRRAAAVR